MIWLKLSALTSDVGCGNLIHVASGNSFNFNICLESVIAFTYLLPFLKDNPFRCHEILPSMGLKAPSAWNVVVLSSLVQPLVQGVFLIFFTWVPYPPLVPSVASFPFIPLVTSWVLEEADLHHGHLIPYIERIHHTPAPPPPAAASTPPAPTSPPEFSVSSPPCTWPPHSLSPHPPPLGICLTPKALLFLQVQGEHSPLRQEAFPAFLSEFSAPSLVFPPNWGGHLKSAHKMFLLCNNFIYVNIHVQV